MSAHQAPHDPLMGANHLTAVRWVLASLVALGHYWLLTTAYEPIRLYHWTGGYIAVNGFFILSGLLIAKSLYSRRNLKAYFMSRALRIYPALITIVLAFAFIFTVFFSKPGGLGGITSSETWQYVMRVLYLGDPQGAPGGIFAGNLEEDFNGPLWTIRFEIVAYILAALAFAVGAVSGFKRVLSLYLIVQAAYLILPFGMDVSALPASIMPLLRLSSAFLMGMTLWQWPAARRPAWWVVAVLVAIFALLGGTAIGELPANIALAAILMRVGLPQKAIPSVVKLPDYSYGIYIWHYPVLQAVLFLYPNLGPWGLMLIGTPIFLGLSALSWHLIEKPVLKFKPRPKVTASSGALHG